MSLLFALTRRQTMRSHPSIYSSEDCMKKLNYFLSKGNKQLINGHTVILAII
jgi:hypothetical protein